METRHVRLIMFVGILFVPAIESTASSENAWFADAPNPCAVAKELPSYERDRLVVSVSCSIADDLDPLSREGGSRSMIDRRDRNHQGKENAIALELALSVLDVASPSGALTMTPWVWAEFLGDLYP